MRTEKALRDATWCATKAYNGVFWYLHQEYGRAGKVTVNRGKL
jgi:hypothetical protein